jgi:hypothetical protein
MAARSSVFNSRIEALDRATRARRAAERAAERQQREQEEARPEEGQAEEEVSRSQGSRSQGGLEGNQEGDGRQERPTRSEVLRRELAEELEELLDDQEEYDRGQGQGGEGGGLGRQEGGPGGQDELLFGVNVSALRRGGASEEDILQFVTMKSRGTQPAPPPPTQPITNEEARARVNLMNSLKFPALEKQPEQEALDFYFGQVDNFIKGKRSIGVEPTNEQLVTLALQFSKGRAYDTILHASKYVGVHMGHHM